MTENKKISADFTSSFGAIEPKRKHRIERISRDGQFGKNKACTELFPLLWNSLWND